MNEKISPYRWVILGVLWITYLSVQLLRLNIGPIAPFLKDSITLTNTEVGFLVTAAGVAYLPAMALSGWAADRFGIRQVLLFGTIFGGVMVLLIYFFPSYQAMLVLMTLSGAGFGCIFASAVKGIINWFPISERATALGINQTAINFSGVAGAALFPLIAGNLGWQYCFLVSGAFILIIGIASSMVYRDPQSRSELVSTKISASKTSFRETWHLLANRHIWLLATGSLFLFIIEFALIANLVLYLKEDLDFAVITAGTVLAVTQIGGAVNKPLSGLLSDKLVRKRKPVFLAMCILATLLCLLIALKIGQGGWVIYLLFVLLGAATNGASGVYTALAGELIPREHAGTIVGICTALAAMWSLLGPPLFGRIVDVSHSYQLAWTVMAVCGLLSIILVSFVREKKTYN